MSTESQTDVQSGDQTSAQSVAHSIISKFIAELSAKDGFAEIAKSLERVVYTAPSEAALRTALFGDESI
jgi:hypothetical protein